MRELIIVDPVVVTSDRASNAVQGAPFSFRTQMEWLAGSDQDPAVFSLTWLQEWTRVRTLGPHAAPVTPRPSAQRLLIDPWWRASAAEPEAPTSAGSYGGATEPPALERLPFRLIAIVNRLDLHAGACSGAPGELRYVYTAVDSLSSRALPMTVIVEIPYPRTLPATEWARAWHELSDPTARATSEARLEALSRAVRKDADPLAARVRSNELALAGEDPSWELREFRVEADAGGRRLAQTPLEHTPRVDVDPSLVDAHVTLNAAAIRGGAFPLPPALRAGAARVPVANFSWASSNLNEPLRAAFSRETCNGCHGGDTRTLPFQHISAEDSSTRAARLSRFLVDPGAPSDELRRRSQVLEMLLQTTCAGVDGEAEY